LDVLGSSMDLFAAEKILMHVAHVAPLEPARRTADAAAAGSVAASLAWLTLERRALGLGIELPPGGPLLSTDPLVADAENALANG